MSYLFDGAFHDLGQLIAMRPLVVLTAIIIAATRVTPFDLAGIDIGVDHVGEMTLTIIILIGLFFTLE
ncbi:hypothetical protein [Aeoliella sp. SH292]|uniref:hypothetical protein n=1 Tax=Aeoliella sp. SH292 TaxID=3454464 RepID=UPI003F9A67B4